MQPLEDTRRVSLLYAQNKAQRLFAEIAAQKLICHGRSETEINASIYELAQRMYGISCYWHKRIVRAGKNTLEPYNENPPDLKVGEDDIVFLDLGPVFESWEVDFGRTYVVGSDPVKHKLCRDIEDAFAAGQKIFSGSREHYWLGTLSIRRAPRSTSWLGIRRPYRRTFDRRISSRENSR